MEDTGIQKQLPRRLKLKKSVVGYKTTLSYFVGKQPNGARTNWLMQEYWLESSGHNKTVCIVSCFPSYSDCDSFVLC